MRFVLLTLTALTLSASAQPPAEIADTAGQSFAGLCAAATSANAQLLVSRRWTALPTQACTAPIRFVKGGILQPGRGQTLRLAALTAPPIHIFDESAGGNIRFVPGTTLNLLPQWWGALGDALHDDTAALQSAIAAAQASGIPLVIPAGNYRADTPTNGVILNILTLCNTPQPQDPMAPGCGLTIRGAGIGKSTIFTTAKGVDLMAAISTAFNVPAYDLSDFTLRGPDTNAPRTRSSGNGLRISGAAVAFPRISNVFASNFYGAGKAAIWLDNTEEMSLSHVWGYYSDIGVKLTSSMNGSLSSVYGNRDRTYGMYVSDASGLTFTGALIQSNELDGLYCSCKQNTFSSPWFENNVSSLPAAQRRASGHYDMVLQGFSNTFTSPVVNGDGEPFAHLIAGAYELGNNLFTSVQPFGQPAGNVAVTIDTGATGNVWFGMARTQFTGTGTSPFVEQLMMAAGRSNGAVTSYEPLVQFGALKFAQLSAYTGGCNAAGIGYIVNITDSPVSLPGAAVTAGGGTAYATLACNGVNWHVLGGSPPAPFTRAQLPPVGPAYTNGVQLYCSDCRKTTPCLAGGAGAIAKALNNAWDCN